MEEKSYPFSLAWIFYGWRRRREEGDWDWGEEGGGVLELSFDGVSSMLGEEEIKWEK